MWGRISEFFLGLWLAISCLIFGYLHGFFPVFIHDLICFVLIAIFSLASYITKFRHLHLMNIGIGFWLICFSAMGYAPFAANQNYITIGLLLLMFSLVPTHADLPPYSWMQFMKKRERREQGAQQRE